MVRKTQQDILVSIPDSAVSLKHVCEQLFKKPHDTSLVNRFRTGSTQFYKEPRDRLDLYLNVIDVVTFDALVMDPRIDPIKPNIYLVAALRRDLAALCSRIDSREARIIACKKCLKRQSGSVQVDSNNIFNIMITFAKEELTPKRENKKFVIPVKTANHLSAQ